MSNTTPVYNMYLRVYLAWQPQKTIKITPKSTNVSFVNSSKVWESPRLTWLIEAHLTFFPSWFNEPKINISISTLFYTSWAPQWYIYIWLAQPDKEGTFLVAGTHSSSNHIALCCAISGHRLLSLCTVYLKGFII